MTHIFVVDDDPSILRLISEYLRKENFTVSEFPDGLQLVNQVKACNPDFLILDIMMPHINGLTLLTELRTFTEMPIIMVSARGDEMDRIIGLELGCNDFLSKPFNPRELVGRVKSMLRLVRRTIESEPGETTIRLIQAGNLNVNEEFRRVFIQDTGSEEIGGSAQVDMALTSREYDLLLFFSKHVERPFTREQLIQQIWNYDYLGDVRVVDDLVKRIRKKLSEQQSTFQIDTIWGFGYKSMVRQS
ncbi:two-component system response regulator ResD [Paenibacillus shirakamiensis]|uniref:Two-component system response regulator ResD n=1 Tax=Paenibacillus shirakamiensis TaxID=1265935 RepID=A0ABS4JFF2_9BACL|nr:response regulator transcription factor [Paenibacillus shirakamiensis]MBP2000435.1 two-component system response regulator ResD [Paenibacillus shirakamiensis]